MEFKVLFYVDRRGRKPVIEFLESLRRSNPTLHKLTAAGIQKLQNRDPHGPPLTTQIDADYGIFELRVGGTVIARVFFFFQPGRRIILTNGYVKKQQRLDRRELDRARSLKSEWEERHT